MSAGRVLTLGLGTPFSSVKYLVTLGLGTSGTPVVPPVVVTPTEVIRNFSLSEWRNWHRPEELKKRRISTSEADAISKIAERQAETLQTDEQKRLDELEGELRLLGIQIETRHLEMLALERERLIDEEIGRRLREMVRNNDDIVAIMLMAAS